MSKKPSTKRNRLAVDAARRNVFMMDPATLTIITDKKHPRYDERIELDLDPGLVANIAALGVLKPVLACKNGDAIEVLDGRQRVRSALEVNKRRRAQGGDPVLVPVLIRRGSDDAAAYFTQVSANIVIADSPAVKARKARHMSEVLGKSDSEIAVAFGVAEATVKNWLALMDCTQLVQRAVDAGKVTLTDAVRKLAKLPREEQEKALGELAAKTPARERTANGKAKGPQSGVSRARVRKVLGKLGSNGSNPLHEHARVVLRWVAGEVSDGDLVGEIPGMSTALEA
jgi:ParB family transcriptional regulator, chromosome partitioning protein